MLSRCTNRKRRDYKHYGGRGITVCVRWRKFENFLADMGEVPKGLTLERGNNDSGYSRQNCHWATQSEQQKNKTTTVRYIFRGRTKTLSEWAEILGASKQLLSWRLKAWGSFQKGKPCLRQSQR